MTMERGSISTETIHVNSIPVEYLRMPGYQVSITIIANTILTEMGVKPIECVPTHELYRRWQQGIPVEGVVITSPGVIALTKKYHGEIKGGYLNHDCEIWINNRKITSFTRHRDYTAILNIIQDNSNGSIQ